MMTLSSITRTLIMLGVIGLLVSSVGASDNSTTTEICWKIIMSMLPCLPYYDGNEVKPTTDCCTLVNVTVQSDKECLCHFIALVHQRIPAVVNLGAQEAKLVQLPTACGIKNFTASSCPKPPPPKPTINVGHKEQTTILGVLVLIASFIVSFPIL